MRKFIFRFALVSILLVVAHPVLAEGPGIKVIVLPFDMYAREDISALRRDVMEALAKELYKAGADMAGIERIKDMMLKEGIESFDEETAFKLLDTVVADFALLGSVSRLDSMMSVDWRLLDLKEKRIIASYFKSSDTENDLVAKVREEAGVSYQRMVASLDERLVERKGTIDRITVSGTRRIDKEAVMGKLLSKAGEEFSPDNLKEDIRAIFAMGYFDDVMADLVDTASGKELKFIVKERPFIKKIEISGNTDVTTDKIMNTLTIKTNSVLDHARLKEDSELIKALYESEGYYLADVIAETQSDGIDANVVFRVDEGKEVKIKRITIIGNEKFSDREIKSVMETKEKGIFSSFTGSGTFSKYMIENDLNMVLAHYFNNGYIDAEILDHSVLLSEDRKWFYLTIALKEGEQYKVGHIDVAGDILTSRDDVIKKLKIKSGQVFSRAKLTKGIEAVSAIYGDKGYANVDIAPRTEPKPETRAVDLTIEIAKNELVYIERIDIKGNTRTRDKVIRRELEVSEGDLFSYTDVKRSKGNLRRLGYFEDVKVVETQGTERDKLKLDVEVSERPTGAFSIGMGFSSVDKLIATTSISQTNLLGTGRKLELSGTVSSNSNNFVLSFTEPWLFDKELSAGVDIYNTGRQYPDFDMKKSGFGLRFGFPIVKHYTYGYVSYRIEDVEISDVADSASLLIQEQEGNRILSGIKFALKHDTRDDYFFPTEGILGNISTEFAGGFLGGDEYFIKHEGSLIKFFPMPWETTFSMRGMLGYVYSFGSHDVPIYEKYFIGGINTLRGFESRKVGPKDSETDEYIGGETMVVTNFEYLFPLFSQPSWRGLVFFDMGNAYDGGIDLGDLRYSAGIGARWFSPVGPVRIELGFNLDPEEDEEDQQWEFTIGNIF
ncbi:MAG: outer membrane protein assembly factor BamA [Deltaproteobacteria bacterium]|nr:outer membrane protein assembly factor BamA [Deltaproteobacteria bacterium]